MGEEIAFSTWDKKNSNILNLEIIIIKKIEICKYNNFLRKKFKDLYILKCFSDVYSTSVIKIIFNSKFASYLIFNLYERKAHKCISELSLYIF